MGKGVIGSVTEQMMSLFANNLQAMLAEAAPLRGAPAGPPRKPVPGDPRARARSGVGRNCSRCRSGGGHRRNRPLRRAAAGRPGSLDALSLAKGIAAEQLSSPVKVLGVIAVVACIAYWAGRRSAFRLLRLCGRL